MTSAAEIGGLIAERGAVLVTGGLGGVMEAASRGAIESGGVAIGLLPGGDRVGANRWLTASVPTGIGELRNGLVVRAADCVIACGGSWGTLSEIALALRSGKPVVALDGWDLSPFKQPGDETFRLPIFAGTPEEAVDLAFEEAGGTGQLGSGS